MHETTDRKALLAAYADLRVADIRDGMDTMMLHAIGSVCHQIRPLWRTRTVGIARTARYVAYDGLIAKMTPEEYAEWTAWYYAEICPYPWMDDLQAGDFVVIDAGGVDAGLMGSENTLAGIRRGAVGYVTTGGVRDTDEIIHQNVPFWAARISQSMVQGRLQFDAADVAVQVGGVTVHPGDVVAADGDGVIVVPRDVAAEVAGHARAEHERDKKVRRGHYEALNIEPDETV